MLHSTPDTATGANAETQRMASTTTFLFRVQENAQRSSQSSREEAHITSTSEIPSGMFFKHAGRIIRL
ncbi:MAG: hypothetical protein ACPGN3_00190 [Opitutales bacterium]